MHTDISYSITTIASRVRIDEIKRPFASKESSINGEQASDVLSECKDSANRVKYQIYLDIFEMQPISDQRSEIRD